MDNVANRFRFRMWVPESGEGEYKIEAHMNYNPSFGKSITHTWEVMDQRTMDSTKYTKVYVNDVFSCPTDGSIWMQSTGLLDSTKWEDLTAEEQKVWLDSGKKKEEWKGKEIFQSDIVKDCLGELYVVVWPEKYITGDNEDIMAWCLDHVDNLHGLKGLDVQSSYEIIGNIYSDPNLLK